MQNAEDTLKIVDEASTFDWKFTPRIFTKVDLTVKNGAEKGAGGGRKIYIYSQ
jgi:hypothetical protein